MEESPYKQRRWDGWRGGCRGEGYIGGGRGLPPWLGERKISERRRKRKAVEDGSEKLAVMYSSLRRLCGYERSVWMGYFLGPLQ